MLDHLKPDARQHGPFYSLCQAVFYIFVFKHRPLLEMEGGECRLVVFLLRVGSRFVCFAVNRSRVSEAAAFGQGCDIAT